MSVWRIGRAPPRGQSPDQVVRTMCTRNGCLQYVDYRDVKGIADGADITTWPARIGADPTQPTPALRPTRGAGGRFVEFGGDLNGNALPTPAVDLSGTDDLTFVIVAYTRNLTSGRIVWENGNPYYTKNGAICLFNEGRISIGTGTSSAGAIAYRTAAISIREVNVIGGSFDRSTSDDLLDLHDQDGEILDFAQQGDADGVGSYAANASYMGGRNNGAVAPLDGGIAVGIWLPVNLPHRELQALVEAVGQIVGVR